MYLVRFPLVDRLARTWPHLFTAPLYVGLNGDRRQQTEWGVYSASDSWAFPQRDLIVALWCPFGVQSLLESCQKVVVHGTGGVKSVLVPPFGGAKRGRNEKNKITSTRIFKIERGEKWFIRGAIPFSPFNPISSHLSWQEPRFFQRFLNLISPFRCF